MHISDAVRQALTKLKKAVNQRFSGDVTDYHSRQDQDGNWSFEMDIGEAAHISCALHPSAGTLILRSESSPRGMDQQEIEDLGLDITEKTGARMTTYDGVLAIMKAVSFADTRDPQRLIFNESMAFIQSLALHKGRLLGEEDAVGNPLINDNGEDDPFGFDDIGEEEELEKPAGGAAEDTEEEEEEDFFSDESDAEDMEEGEPEVKVPEAPPANEKEIQSLLASVGAESSQEKELLSGLLKDLENEAPLEDAGTDLDLDSLIPVPDVIDVEAGEPEAGVDVLNSVDTYHGSDQYELVARTREYKDAARRAMDQMHDILSSLYSPVYRLSIDLYKRDTQLAMNEQNIQQSMDALGARQRKMDQMEAQILQQQQALLQDRANFNQYKETVRDILNDYDIKCRIVDDQADELRELRYELSRKTEEAEQLRRQLDGVLGKGQAASLTQEYADAILAANKKLNGLLAQYKERLSKCYRIIDAFRALQKSWENKEAEYKALVGKLRGSSILSDAVKTEIKESEKRISELEVAVEKNRRLAEEQGAEADRQRARADLAEEKGEELKGRAREERQKASEMEQRAKKAEEELARQVEESDMARCATTIREDMAYLGVDLKAVAGEGTMVMSGHMDGCEVVIDVEQRIIYIKKPAKKPQKYMKRIAALNERDIRTTWAAGEGEITCRAAYHKAAAAAPLAGDILDAMKEF